MKDNCLSEHVTVYVVLISLPQCSIATFVTASQNYSLPTDCNNTWDQSVKWQQEVQLFGGLLHTFWRGGPPKPVCNCRNLESTED
eukprot:6199254-Amphidinium_carterae.1